MIEECKHRGGTGKYGLVVYDMSDVENINRVIEASKFNLYYLYIQVLSHIDIVRWF